MRATNRMRLFHGGKITKKQFLEEHRHELFGMIADAATNKVSGAPLACMLREYARKIDQRLEAIYDHFIKTGEKLEPTRETQAKNGMPQHQAERNGVH